MTSLIGVIFFGIGLWNLWSAHAFAETAAIQQGTFSGYQTIWHKTTVRSGSASSQGRSKETVPMFYYTDRRGKYRLVAGNEGHLFHRFKNGDLVKVLVSPDDAVPPRLGDFISLYGNGLGFCFSGSLIILFFFLIIKIADRFMGPLPETSPASVSSLRVALSEFGQGRFPVGDLFFFLGGFVVIAGCSIGLIMYFALKWNDASLIDAIQKGAFDRAKTLATENRGILSMDRKGEKALIVALKADQPEIARQILQHVFVRGDVYTADGTSAVQLAASNGDTSTLSLLLKKGGSVLDIKDQAVCDLVKTGDAALFKILLESGLDPKRMYGSFHLGDLAVINGREDIISLIKDYNGIFKAPPVMK